MPAATTHCEFAKYLLDTNKERYADKIPNRQMYCLGSQGPDIFFFHRASVLPGSLAKVGNQMHDEWAWPVIQYMKNHCTSPALQSYFYGYLTHYALDSSCHPIINAYSQKISKEKGVSESEIHFAIEGEIDAWTLAEQHRSIESYGVYKDLSVSDSEAKALGSMYHNLFEEVMNLSISEKKIAEAAKDISRYTKILKPGEKKFRNVDKIENLVKMPKLITGMMLSNKENAHPCVLNDGKETWIYDGREETRGYVELRKEAEVLALKLFDGPNEADVHRNFCGDEMPKISEETMSV